MDMTFFKILIVAALPPTLSGTLQYCQNLVKHFWTNAEIKSKTFIPNIIAQEVTINLETIVEATSCPRFDNYYYEGWDKMYSPNGIVERTFYGANFKLECVDREIIYKELSSLLKLISQSGMF
ncbi:hypothetical protein LR48_Vigan2443s000100 [Vigna angularis]|nr:hypothetical protein LR48_Vigan2443s000100 [Vigna angularis]